MIAGFLANAWAKIAACAAIIFAVLAGLLKVYGAGKTAAREQGQREQLENVAARNQVDDSISRNSDASNRARLRSRWTRG